MFVVFAKPAAPVAMICRYLCTVLLLIVALQPAQNVWAEEPADNGKTILVLGDSISAGFGIPMQQGWVALLGKELQRRVPAVQLVNASISGDTTQGGLTRLPQLLKSHQPDLVIIELGGNDGLRGMPIRLIKHNLTALIQLSREAGSDILLAGMQIPPNYGRKYTHAFREIYPTLAQSHNTLLVPFILASVAAQAGLMQADGIHPTAEGQPLIVDQVRPLVQQWLLTQ